MAQNHKEIVEYAKELESNLNKRNELFKKCEQIFTLEWDDQPTKTGLKITLSPDARNAALGAIRLMIATSPTFNVPYDKSSSESKELSEKIEMACSSIWYQSGRISQMPPETDIVTAGILYGETHVAITDTETIYNAAKEGSKAEAKRADRARQRTPVIFEAINPKEGYPDFDKLGLAAYYRKRKVTGNEIRRMWGKKSNIEDGQMYEPFDYCDFWDQEVHSVWIEGVDKPIFEDAHNMPVIPIAAQIIEGSSMFEKQENRRQPFLYTVQKSGMWERQNLWLTVFYSLLFEIGNGPIWGFEASNPEREIEVAGDEYGSYFKWLQGESFTPMVNSIFDPQMMVAQQLADDKVTESTLYKQALGEPLGSNAPFAMVSLLHHAGRLPLVSQQRRGGWVIGQAMEVAMELIRDGKKKRTIATGDKGTIELDPGEIPDNISIEGQLDISLPQDSRMNAMVAKQLTDGERPLTSLAWAREKVLQIGQSDQMTKEIWAEKFSELEAMREYAIELQRVQQMIQMASQPPGSPGGGGMPQSGGGQMPQNIPPGGQVLPEPSQMAPGRPETGLNGQMGENISGGGEMLNPAVFEGMTPEQITQQLAAQGMTPEQIQNILEMMAYTQGQGGI